MKDDGGAAFPHVRYGAITGEPIAVPGMSLRDWFAGQALSGMPIGLGDNEETINHRVRMSYQYADAMIAERKKNQ